MNRRTLLNLLKYVLAFGLLAYVVRSNWGEPGKGGLGDVWQSHVIDGKPVHGGFLLAGFVIYLAAVLLTILRWYLLVRAQGLPFTLPAALRLGLIGCFFNAFLPGGVGGDIVKAAVLARGQSRRTVAVATVIMDRVIALWGLIWFVALAGGLFWATGWLQGEAARRAEVIVTLAASVSAGSLVVWLLLGLLPPARAERFAGRLERLPRVGVSAAEFWRAVWLYRCRQASVFLTLLLSWVGHVGFVLAFWCSAQTLWDGQGGLPTLPQHFLLVPMGLVVQAVVPFPGGVGAGEWGFGALYELFHGAARWGVLGSLVLRIATWVIGLLGLAFYLGGKADLAPPNADAAPGAAGEPEPAAA